MSSDLTPCCIIFVKNSGMRFQLKISPNLYGLDQKLASVCSGTSKLEEGVDSSLTTIKLRNLIFGPNEQISWACSGHLTLRLPQSTTFLGLRPGRAE